MEDNKRNLAQNLQLDSLELIASKFNVIKENKEKTGRVKISIELGNEAIAEENSNILKKIIGMLKVNIKGVTEDSIEDEIFSMEVVFESNYSAHNEFVWENEEIDHFVLTSMYMHMWPYVREYASELTQKSPLKDFILPLMPVGQGQLKPKN